MLSVACVGSHLRLLRTRSGAPADGNFEGAQPCPIEWTPALPLLAEWDPRTPGASCPPAAPPAFSALLRLLLAPPLLLNPLAAPHTEVELDCGQFQGTVQLQARLGCGGTCDAYRVVIAAAEPLVLKLPRCATKAVAICMTDEANALRALARGGGGSVAAPWGSRGDNVDKWLQAQADADAEAASALRSLLWHLRFLAAADATPAPSQYYQWPWPQVEVRFTRRSAAQAAPPVDLGARLAAALQAAGKD